MTQFEQPAQWVSTTSVIGGDVIRFKESVYCGSVKRPKYIGERTIEAAVLSESYGAIKQQHTFTLRVVDSDGIEALRPLTKILRKGRNIYRFGVERLLWKDETERQLHLEEKRKRGTEAARMREHRKEFQNSF